MQYQYSPPRAERHLVEWDRRQHPGIYDAASPKAFGSLSLHPDLVAWLDAHAPGWSFRSDWDHANAGDDDEGCHLTVSSEAEGEGFVAIATAMSTAWTAADRERMPFRVSLVVGDGETTEIARGHVPHDVTMAVERAVRNRAGSNDFRTGTLAGRDARVGLANMAARGETRREVALTPLEALRVPARLVLEIRTAPTETGGTA